MNQLTEMDLWNHKQASVKIFLRLLARKCFQKKGFISSKDKKNRRLNVEFSISSAQITKLSSGLFASYLLTTPSKTLSRVRARGVCSWGGGVIMFSSLSIISADCMPSLVEEEIDWGSVTTKFGK